MLKSPSVLLALGGLLGLALLAMAQAAPLAWLAFVGFAALAFALQWGTRARPDPETAASELAQAVAARTAALSELAQHLQDAREDERQRLARDLHDELGALLTSAKLDAARIRSRLAAQVGGAPEASERLAHLVATLDHVVALKRRVIEDLRPSALSHLGLAATLDILAREFAASAGLRLDCELQAVTLKPRTELMIYRLVQEALTNIGKHAKAQHLSLRLSQLEGQVLLTVRDDGQGFDARPGALEGGGHGLNGMRFRVEAEGGQLTLRTAPGQGCELQLRLPVAHGD